MIVNIFDGNDDLSKEVAPNFPGEKIMLMPGPNVIKSMVDQLVALSQKKNAKISKLRLIGHGGTAKNVNFHFLSTPKTNYVTMPATTAPDINSYVLHSRNITPGWQESKQIIDHLTDFTGGEVTIPYAKLRLTKSKTVVSELERLKPIMSSDGEIFVMSCQVARGGNGDHFLQSLADLTGVRVLGGISYQSSNTVMEAIMFEGNFKVAKPGGSFVWEIPGSYWHVSFKSRIALAYWQFKFLRQRLKEYEALDLLMHGI